MHVPNNKCRQNYHLSGKFYCMAVAIPTNRVDDVYLQIMVDKRLLERMLELGLLERVLVRGDLTKQLIHQGVLRDILELEIIDAMVKPENVPVLYQLLDGEMLEVMVSTNILRALKVHA